MKKLFIVVLMLAVGVLFMSTLASAIGTGYTGETSTTAGTGINGTVHDLRRANTRLGYNANPADYLDRLCIFCHAPHHTYRPSTAGSDGTGPLAPDDYTYLPLWNHVVTTQTFVPYYSGPDAPQVGPKSSQAIANFDKIGASSLLCLSCHDGTIAVNSYGNAPQSPKSISSGGSSIMAEYNIGSSGYLANHHPIGFPYDSALATADPDIYDPSVAVFDHSLDAGNGGGLSSQDPVTNLLWGGKMECGTCHAVHNKGNSGEKLLYVSDKNSNLCFSCHNKGSKTGTLAP